MTAPAALDGKVALVTGASRGIGRAIAGALARQGASVYLGARDETRLAEAVKEILAAGGKASALTLDVSDRSSAQAAVKTIVEAQGHVIVCQRGTVVALRFAVGEPVDVADA